MTSEIAHAALNTVASTHLPTKGGNLGATTLLRKRAVVIAPVVAPQYDQPRVAGLIGFGPLRFV